MDYDHLFALREHLLEELADAEQAGDSARVEELRGMIARVDRWIPEAAMQIDRRVRFEGLEVPEDRQERFRELRCTLPLN